MSKNSEVPVLSEPDKVIKVGINNLRPETLIDDRSKFNLPRSLNLDDLVVISSPVQGLGRETELSRTGTEGRAMSAHVEPFSDYNGVVYSDVLVKGVGAPQRKRLNLVGEGRSTLQTEGTKRVGGTSIPMRFSTNQVYGIQGKYGFKTMDMLHVDSNTSDFLASKGLRTRRLILSGQYPDRKIFATDEGVVTASEIAKIFRKPIIPSIELWAMRCRYRVRDIIDYRYESRFAVEEEYKRIMSDDNIREITKVPYEERLRKEGKISDEEIQRGRETFSKLSIELIERMSSDTDARFVAIAEQFADRDMDDPAVLKQFYGLYMNTFSEVLGEQVGIMYSEGAFTKKKMLNSQNVTLLGEIVDHDVTFFDESMKDNGLKVVEQIDQTYTGSLIKLSSDLLILDLLPDDTVLANFYSSYIDGFMGKLSPEDQSRLASAVKDSFDTETPIEEYEGYKDMQKLLAPDLISYHKASGKYETYIRLQEQYRQKLRFDPITKRWVNKDDISGSGRNIFLLERLSNLNKEDNKADPLQPLRRAA